MDTTFADEMLALGTDSESWLVEGAGYNVGLVLIAAFGIAVGFVAYKLIKRALNKA